MKKAEVIQPTAIACPVCSEGDKSTIPLNDTLTNKASLKKGFPTITQVKVQDGGLPPERVDFNGLFYLSTDLRFFLQNGCFISFNQNVSNAINGYPQDAILSYIDSNNKYMLVRSLIDDNTNDFTQDETLIDNIHWKKIDFGGGGGGGASYSGMMFDLVKKDHQLTFEESFGLQELGTYAYKTSVIGTRYGYPDFVEKVIEEYDDPNNTTRQLIVGADTITITTNSNGHEFYDIADKAIIDNLYNDKKVAWFYGVDKTNNRIFLPRNDYIANDGRVIGNGKTLNITNGTNYAGLISRTIIFGIYNGKLLEESLDDFNQDISTQVLNPSQAQGTWGIPTDADKSSIVLNQFGYVYMVLATNKKQEIEGTIVTPEQEILARLSVAEAKIQDIEDADYIDKYENGDSGYIIDNRTKLCIQWGQTTTTGNTQAVTLYQEYKNANYNIQTQPIGTTALSGYQSRVGNKTTTGFSILSGGSDAGNGYFNWLTIGYIN